MDLQRIQSENMNNEDAQAAEGAETAIREKRLMQHRKRRLRPQKLQQRKLIMLSVKTTKKARK